MNFARLILNRVVHKRSRLPLVAICGSTGTGKSELAIEIANHYNGEIINYDSIQIYKGFDVLTNKVPEGKRKDIKHHLLGTVDLETLNYSVHDFQKISLEKINELWDCNKIPILVGGTNYYIQSVLWDTLVKVTTKCSGFVNETLDNMNNNELYDSLQILDPEMAILLHPNDRRKVIRAIKISLNSTENQSSHLRRQVTRPRFSLNDVVLIWIDCERDVLFQRLDARVLTMLSNGLLDELEALQKQFLKLNLKHGIFQAIGFEQFQPYIQYENKNSNFGHTLLKACINDFKIANKKYAKYQRKCVANIFLKKLVDRMSIPLFKVDSTDILKWDEVVLGRSLKIIDQIIKSVSCYDYDTFVKQLAISPEPLMAMDAQVACHKICYVCDKLFVKIQQYEAHINGRKHKSNLMYKNI